MSFPPHSTVAVFATFFSFRSRMLAQGPPMRCVPARVGGGKQAVSTRLAVA